ncbi:MAG: GH92 family glycosyl hydrolase [Porphyromonas sp.]|nr:GH92 family glycosyl hydrolase [Porphyromonas sp.]
MQKRILPLLLASALAVNLFANEPPQKLIDYVDPFVGTTNYGTTNPGARVPHGLMSVTPFNVMGSPDNLRDKDASWWSTPYEYHNSYLTGFAHVNLSGVGCPDMGSLLLMASTGALDVDYHHYGSTYSEEAASPGFYTNILDKYGIKSELTSTLRTGVSRFTFPKGESHILLNLGEGLTNESGAMVKRVSTTEIEGHKLLGNFCYVPQAVYPIYFVMRVSREPKATGYWKLQRSMTGAEADWDPDQGNYKLYTKYDKELSGDDIGAYFTFDTEEGEEIVVELAVSFVSTENARENLDAETAGKTFEQIRTEAEQLWERDLGRIEVTGGTLAQRRTFYTALFHLLVHPSILQDVNGEYPQMEGSKTLHTDGNRYTVFSLWDTYRNVHQFMTLVYPERQTEMLQSMLDMYREHGWLPKWELFGRESLTMEGDPAIPVFVDSYLKGLRDFDVELAYEAMYKSATAPGSENLLRPDNDDYMQLGYVPLRDEFDNSVSHALEYYVADHALSLLAQALGKHEDAKYFYNRSLGYKHYYSPEYKSLRPKLPDGSFLTPFDPELGKNFEPNPGFHEGCAWNYTFFVPHDVQGLMKLMGGKRKFVNNLQHVFDEGHFDPTNEPDIAYPHLFSYIRGEEWRTQKLVTEILNEHYTDQPDGLPGNDDTGTLSCWALFNMMGLYPDCPGVPEYTLTAPVFDKVVIHLDPKYHKGATRLVIEGALDRPDQYIQDIELGGKRMRRFRVSHDELLKAGTLRYNYRR